MRHFASDILSRRLVDIEWSESIAKSVTRRYKTRQRKKIAASLAAFGIVAMSLVGVMNYPASPNVALMTEPFDNVYTAQAPDYSEVIWLGME